ncbi:hypothetical protein K3495_g7319 [Podosphaera aphanis]|nr:hypothetical protein K3495_g7319 [Podosphaera aphanis]
MADGYYFVPNKARDESAPNLSHVQHIILPTRSSYVLQPPDLAVFLPLKSGYQKIIAEPTYMDGTALNKKQFYLDVYHPTRAEKRLIVYYGILEKVSLHRKLLNRERDHPYPQIPLYDSLV